MSLAENIAMTEKLVDAAIAQAKNHAESLEAVTAAMLEVARVARSATSDPATLAVLLAPVDRYTALLEELRDCHVNACAQLRAEIGPVTS